MGLEWERETMKKTVLEIYAMAVCFFSVVVFVVALVTAAWDVVQWAAPEFTVNDRVYECHQSDEFYRECQSEAETGFWRAHGYGARGGEQSEAEPLAGAELTKRRENSYRRLLNAERRDAARGLAQKTLLALVVLVLFGAHWRLAKRSRSGASE